MVNWVSILTTNYVKENEDLNPNHKKSKLGKCKGSKNLGCKSENLGKKGFNVSNPQHEKGKTTCVESKQCTRKTEIMTETAMQAQIKATAPKGENDDVKHLTIAIGVERVKGEDDLGDEGRRRRVRTGGGGVGVVTLKRFSDVRRAFHKPHCGVCFDRLQMTPIVATATATASGLLVFHCYLAWRHTTTRTHCSFLLFINLVLFSFFLSVSFSQQLGTAFSYIFEHLTTPFQAS